MIWRSLLLLGLILIIVTASNPEYGVHRFIAPPKIPEEVIEDQLDDVREVGWLSPSAVEKYLKDHQNRISPEFKISDFFYPNVYFWFLTYTRFDSNQVVIHDKSNLSLIYKVLDFSHLQQKGLHRHTLHVLQANLANEKVKELKEDIGSLINDPFNQSPKAIQLLQTLQQAGINLPEKKDLRVDFFQGMLKNIRTQIGQKNFIQDGIIRSLPYQAFIKDYFTSINLPDVLIAIPFLESSFNPLAQSRVSASGAWQFMPFIAQHYMPPRNDELDYRHNVGIASLSAAFLISENFRILKSWDLTVTAYNSGPKHLLKTKRELGLDQVDLETVIKNSDSQHFGFASKNFYSEFLALVHTLAYQEELFPKLHQDERPDTAKELLFYVTKCSLSLNKLLDSNQLDDIAFHNHQLSSTLKQKLPKGALLSAKSLLPGGQFLKLSTQQLKKLKPKEWPKLVAHQSCSTK